MEFVRHLLDLNAKGVGEKSNVFYPGLSQELGRATHVLSNRTVGAYAKGAGDYLFGNMDKFLESPFEFLGVNTEKFTGFANRLKASNYITSNIAGKVMSAIERPHLGLGYARYGNPAKYMGAFAAKRVLPAMIAYNAFGLVDHALGAATMSPTGRGPFTEIPIKAFEAASLAYTKLSDITGLTDWAKWQDRVAPGSTGIGIMAPAATATGLYFMGEKMYQHGPDFIGGTIDKAGRKMLQHPLMRAAARPEAYKGALARGPVENLLSYVIKNPKKGIFGLAMLPSIPFLPGFFGSDKNYAEKKAEYKGEKEVAIRKYRGWLLSSSPFEGGRVRSWRRHSLNLIESDFENRGVVYPSFTDRFMHNASLGMYKPNILEDYHGDAQPVYKSSPWGTNVPLVGPIIAGTIGKLIGTKTYHTPGEYAPREVQEYAGDGANHDQESGLSRSVEMGTVKKLFGDDQNKTGYMIGLQDPSSLNSLASRFADSLGDLSGFRGFSLQTTYEKMAGKNLPDKYTPYAQDSSQMYSPAEQMWQYNLGDITVVGGEFMRRILQNSEKKWEVNDIPNELFGVSWIPQADDQRGTTKDLTHGTTFNKVDMGWLYGSRKGWEFLYPGEAKGDMESYSAPLKTEILQQLAPYSAKFNEAAKETYGQAIGGQLSPKQEQRFYETLDQVSQVKQQLYATAGEYSFALDTEAESGIVDTVQDDGSFSMKGKNYRLAGVSLHEADIRARLLQKNEYNSAQALADDVASIRERTAQIISKHLGPGREVSFNKATATMLPSETESGIEVQIDSLTEELWSAGAPFANTGNLASHNIAQDRDGIMSRVSAAYWDGLTATNSYWNKKLISKRDYLDNYTTNQVYNREVKLWTRPIEHIVKPFLASTVHNLTGIDFIPSFTKERRANQQYWDVVKYIKYKMLSGRAKDEGDMESAAFFESQWRSTMIGADPTDSSMKDVLNALPVNERQYFNNFANEPDPEKRKEIFGYLPEQAKRLYSSIWMRKAAAASNDQQLLANWSKLQESEGWDLSEDEEAEYANETGGRASKADWARAKYVQSYAQKRNLPGAEWSGWNESVDINNVQLLALQEDGENVQDYGFFDSNIRQAIYDDYAYAAATSYESMSVSANVIMGDITPMLMEDSVMSAYATPTSSMSPIREVNIETNGFARILDKLNNFGSEILDDYFTDPY
jgi:hypothetical protein